MDSLSKPTCCFPAGQYWSVRNDRRRTASNFSFFFFFSMPCQLTAINSLPISELQVTCEQLSNMSNKIWWIHPSWICPTVFWDTSFSATNLNFIRIFLSDNPCIFQNISYILNNRPWSSQQKKKISLQSWTYSRCKQLKSCRTQALKCDKGAVCILIHIMVIQN